MEGKVCKTSPLKAPRILEKNQKIKQKKGYTMFMKWKIKYCWVVGSSQIDAWVQGTANHNPGSFEHIFRGAEGIDKWILHSKFTWKRKGLRTAKASLKSNRAEGLTVKAQ